MREFMLEIIQNSRETVIRHIMGRVFVNELSVDSGMRLIAAFQEEYQVAKDSAERYQRACYQITNDKIVVMGGEQG
jgi:uncharacterized protein (DUF2141 family)